MNINNDNTNVNNQNEIPTQLNETMNQQLSYQPQYSPIHELLINMKILDSKVTSIEENLMKLTSRSNQHYQIIESLQKDIAFPINRRNEVFFEFWKIQGFIFSLSHFCVLYNILSLKKIRSTKN